MATTYNGWATHETWLVRTWIANDKTAWEKYNALAQEGEANKDAPLRARVSMLAFLLSVDFYANARELPIPDMFSDMLHVSLGRVDWYDVAKSIITVAP